MEEATYVEGFHDKTKVQKMTYNSFGNTGLRVSKMGLGGGPFGGHFEALEEQEAVAIIKEAFQSGINYIDTAPFYGEGRSEKFIGKAIKDIPREAYYIATKVGRYSWKVEDMFDFSAAKTRWSVENSLKLLGLDYVDVIQVHDLEYGEDLDQVINETLPTLQKLVEEGKARFIGITAYPLKPLKEVIEKSKVKIDLCLSYSRCTLIDDELLKYLPFFQDKGVGVINAGVFGLGLLTLGEQPSWHLGTTEIKEACKKAAEYCKQTNVDFSRLAVQRSFSVEGISTHLLGVGKIEFLRKNLEIATKTPSASDLKQIQELQNRFFSNLSSKNWEGNDAVFEQLKELRKGKN